MKKITLVILVAISAMVFAQENNSKSCENQRNVNVLRCQKIQQMCFRYPAESIAFDMCMDDSFSCFEEIKAASAACMEATKNK